MAVVIDGTTGISTPAETVLGNLSYTGTLTGGTGVVNLGSGQVYKDASGNVGIGTSSPNSYGKLHVRGVQNIGTYGNVSGSFSDGATGSLYVQHSSGLVQLGSDTALSFGTGSSATERARIDSSGNLLVGTTTLGNAGWSFYGSTSLGGAITKTNSTSTFTHVEIKNGNGTVGSIQSSGSSTSYNTSSDYRLKEAITPMTGALAKVALLKPVTYKWKVDGSDGQGFIAHELAEVEAGCVTGEKDAVDAEGNPQYQGIDTSFLVATLAAAIQELKAVVDEQATRITALEGTTA